MILKMKQKTKFKKNRNLQPLTRALLAKGSNIDFSKLLLEYINMEKRDDLHAG